MSIVLPSLLWGGSTTHRFPLEQVNEAFAAHSSKPRGFVKAVVVLP
jgi:threonine dehydrogenase-like Zn-dependent dehydrogenase